MLNPLQIGQYTFPINLIQGPLAGVSTAPFRELVTEYSKPAFTYTEMISCHTLIQSSPQQIKRFIYKSPQEGPVCFQLSGQDPDKLGLAVKMATDYGADLIDLNSGCPVNKIRRKGAGSRLLSQPSLLYQLLSSMKKHTHVPVGVKIRVDAKSHDRFNPEVAKAIQEAGVDFTVVHGRHWQDDYAVPCHYEDIQFFVSELNMPVIGNGDVACLKTLNKMLATGCAGVMISRASVGQPWLIRQLIAASRQEAFTPPNTATIGQLFIRHLAQLAQLLDNPNLALLEGRQFAKYYARPLKDHLAFCKAINQCHRFDMMDALCQQYFSG